MSKGELNKTKLRVIKIWGNNSFVISFDLFLELCQLSRCFSKGSFKEGGIKGVRLPI